VRRPWSARSSPGTKRLAQRHDARGGFGYGPVHLETRVAIDEQSLATLLAELATTGARASSRCSPRRSSWRTRARKKATPPTPRNSQRGLSLAPSAAARNSFEWFGWVRRSHSWAVVDSSSRARRPPAARRGERFDHSAKLTGPPGRDRWSTRARARTSGEREIHECGGVVGRSAF